MAMAITTSGSTRAHAGRMNDPDPEVPERARRRQYSAKYKLDTLAEYDRLDREAKGPVAPGGPLHLVAVRVAQAARPRGAPSA